MIYIVNITETRQKQIKVKAASKRDAVEIAREVYKDKQEVLTADNLTRTTFRVMEAK